jgi:iron complex outermembrane receptor protein
MRTKYILLAAVAATGLGQAMPAFAQEASEAGARVDNGDIVVTARKREESIMKVPVVTNALTSEQIERAQITDIRRVAEQIPGFIVGQGSSAAYGAQLSLRGIGTSVLNGTIDQSVSLNLDGQQFTQGLAFTAAMFDLQQLTVLKGPQALFFGKASPGGVVAIQSANPTPDWQIIARAGYEFEARAKQGELILSGPLTTDLGIRLAGRHTQTDGYFHNIATPTPGTGALKPAFRAPHSKETILRGTLMWEPNELFSARLKVTYSNSRVFDQAGQLASCSDGITGQGIQFIATNENCKVDRNFTQVDMDPAAFPNIAKGGRTFANIEQTFGVLEMNFNVSDPIKLTSVTGYYDVNENDQFNAAQSGAAAPAFSSFSLFNRETLTQELRLTSDFKDMPLNFTVGGFYENTKQHKLGQARLNQKLGLPLNFLPNSLLLSNGTHDNPAESESLFGQLLWKITPQLELAGGARWTHEDREHVYYNLISQPNSNILLKVPRLTSNRVSPELTLTYTPTDDLTIFGALKRGYKSGSFNSSGSFRNGDDTSFGDERVQGGELGVKARMFDRALAFNLSGYYYDYSGLQVGANAATSEGIITTRVLNAASAKVYGLEGDLTYRPRSIEGLSLNLAASWNHARYNKFTNAPCAGGQLASQGCNLDFARSAASAQTVAGPLGGVFVPAAQATNPGGVTVGGTYGFWGFYTSQDLSGRELLRSPDFTVTGGFNYEMPIGGDMKIGFGASGRYSSKYYADIVLRSDEVQPAYAKLNGNITLFGPDDRWELSLIGNNVTDHLVRNKCSLSNAANGVNPLGLTPIKGGVARNAAGVDEVICTIDPGREVWVRATLRL